jgi:hypothetical protein
VSSRTFVVGVLLLAVSIIGAPLSVTLGEGSCSVPGATSASLPSSWDCYQAFTVDFTIPILAASSGIALLLWAVARARRSRTHR